MKFHNSKVLVVEDDKLLNKIIILNLKSKGHCADGVYDGIKALEVIESKRYDLILLDIALPKMNGYSVIKELNQKNLNTPVIVITGCIEETSELDAFKKGATLYHEKPISFELLLEQVSSLLKLTSNNSLISHGNVSIDQESRIVLINEQEVSLTPKEYFLLVALVKAKGSILSRDKILQDTYQYLSDVNEGSVDTLVSRLRVKLSKSMVTNPIETVRGVGYRIKST